MHDVEHALGKSRFEEELGQAHAAKGRALGRLQHVRVPRHHREREHPERDHHGEVERRYARAHAERVPIHVLVDATRNVTQGAALQQRRGAACEIHHLDATADLASRLVERLAMVARDQRGQLLEVLLEDRLEAEHQAHPLHHRRLRPERVRVRGGLNGRVHLGSARERHVVDDLAGGGIEDRERACAEGRGLMLPGDEVVDHAGSILASAAGTVRGALRSGPTRNTRLRLPNRRPARKIVVRGPNKLPSKPPTRLPAGQAPQYTVRKMEFMRPCRLSGVSSWRSDHCVTLFTGSMSPLTMSAPPTIRMLGPVSANDTTTNAAPASTPVRARIQPAVNRLMIRGAKNAPTTAPAPSTLRIHPRTAGVKWRF